MARIKDCLSIAKGFSEREIASLEKQARAIAGTAKFTNAHFIEAARKALSSTEALHGVIRGAADAARTKPQSAGLFTQPKETPRGPQAPQAQQSKPQVPQKALPEPVASPDAPLPRGAKVNAEFDPKLARTGSITVVQKGEKLAQADLYRMDSLDDAVAKDDTLRGAIRITALTGENGLMDALLNWAEKTNSTLVVTPGRANRQMYRQAGFVDQGDIMVRRTQKQAARDAKREQKAEITAQVEAEPTTPWEERETVEAVRQMVDRYNATKTQEDALEMARFILDQAVHGETELVRNLAKAAFENEVDPITQKKAALRPLKEAFGSVPRDKIEVTTFSAKEKPLPFDHGPNQTAKFPTQIGEHELGRLSEADLQDVNGALIDVFHGPLGNMLFDVIERVRGIVRATDSDPQVLGIAWVDKGLIGLTPRSSKEAATSVDGLRMLRTTVAHELTHLLDHAASDPGYGYASSHPNSPLGFNYAYGPNGVPQVSSVGAVMMEALDAYTKPPTFREGLEGKDSPLREALQYPLGALVTVTNEMAASGKAVTKKQVEQFALAAEHATRELLPRLAELYYNDAAALKKDLPVGHALVDALNTTTRETNLGYIKEILNGRADPTAGGVLSKVWSPADDRTDAVAGTVQEGDAGRAGERRAGQPDRTGVQERAGDRRPDQGLAPLRTGADMTPAQQKEAATFKLRDPREFQRWDFATRSILSWLGDWRNRPGALGWLSMLQLKDRFGSKDPKAPNLVDNFITTYVRMGSRAEEIAQILNEVIKPWRNLAAPVQVRLGKLMLEATIAQVHPDVSFDDLRNHHLQYDGKGEKLDEATVEQNRALHGKLRSQYTAFTSQYPRAGEIYDKARRANQKLWDMLADARAKDILRVYEKALLPHFSQETLDQLVRDSNARNTTLATLKDSTLPIAIQRAVRDLIEAAEVNWSEHGQMKGPYFPLTRHGNHVVVTKSTPFKAAVDAYSKARDALQELYNKELPEDKAEAKAYDDAVREARSAATEAKKALEALKESERHYSVTFFESRWEADAYANDLKKDPAAQKHGLEVAVEERAQHLQQFDGASPQFIRKLEEQLKSSLPKSDFGAVTNAVREIYLRAAPDRSALKGELRRLNVPGAKATEMLRGFAQRGMGNAFRISRMEYGGPLQDALAAMKQSDSRDDIVLADEMGKRLALSFTMRNPSAWIDSLAQITHLSFLGASPAYVLTNLSQPWVISMPVMAARHGFARAGQSLYQASGEVVSTIKAMQKGEFDKLKTDDQKLKWLKSWRFNVQPEKLAQNADEERMLREIYNDGLLVITIEHDLGAVSSGASQNALTIASEIASTPAHLAEVVNRVATSLAAFRLERQRGSDYQTAKDYAETVVADTHLDYSAENAPRFMRADSFGGLGRLIWQFRRFTQGMLFLQAKLLMDGARGNTEARKAVAYLWGMILGVAGATGLPVAGGVGLILQAMAKAWDDDDEPELAEMAYNGLKDAVGETAAQALTKGLPAAAGADLSKRLGLSDLTDPLRVRQLQGKEGRDLIFAAMVGMFGPSASMLGNWGEALSTAGNDPLKAAQLALPKLMADPLRAYERAENGLRSKSGDQMIDREEFTPFDHFLRTMGFESTKVSDVYDTRAAVNRLKANQNDVRRNLIADYVQAQKDGEPTGKIMDQIAAFNRRNPSDRIEAKTLQEARKNRAKAATEMVGGARVGKRDRDVLDQLGL